MSKWINAPIIEPLDGIVPDFLLPDPPEWMTRYSERHLVRGEN